MSACSKCGSEMAFTACPDNKPGCAVLHFACRKCTPAKPEVQYVGPLEQRVKQLEEQQAFLYQAVEDLMKRLNEHSHGYEPPPIFGSTQP